MKEIRPFQIIVLGIFAFLAIAGIFFFTTYRGASENQSVGAVRIWGTLPAPAMEEALAVIMRSKAYTEVSYEERSAATFSTDLANAIASGVGPDLVLISHEMLLSEQPKLTAIPFSSLPERTFIDSFLPVFEVFLAPEGSYGIPFLADPLVLYYERGALASAGIANPPATWEAVSGLALTLTQRDARDQILRSTIPLGEYVNVPNARATLSLLLLQSGTSITARDGVSVRSTLVSDGSPLAESAVNFYAQFADPAKTVYSWNRSLPQARQAFLAGDLVFYPGFASERPLLSQANPNLDFDMARMPQPAVNPTRINYAVAYAFAVPRASGNPSGALATAFALTAPEGLQAAARAASMVPARRDLLTPGAEDRYAGVFYPEALIAKAWLSPAPHVTDAIFSAMINDVITGRLDVDDAVGRASQSLDAAI